MVRTTSPDIDDWMRALLKLARVHSRKDADWMLVLLMARALWRLRLKG